MTRSPLEVFVHVWAPMSCLGTHVRYRRPVDLGNLKFPPSCVSAQRASKSRLAEPMFGKIWTTFSRRLIS
jgi:hypothetical protein